jgi:hypothetical protein
MDIRVRGRTRSNNLKLIDIFIFISCTINVDWCYFVNILDKAKIV